MTHVLQAIRGANVAILTAALVFFGVRIADTTQPSRRLLMYGFAVLLVAGIIGSAIKYLTRAPVDGSIVLTTLAGAIVLVGLWRSRHDL